MQPAFRPSAIFISPVRSTGQRALTAALVRSAALLLLLLGLGACGQLGELYLPEAGTEPAATTQQQETEQADKTASKQKTESSSQSELAPQQRKPAQPES